MNKTPKYLTTTGLECPHCGFKITEVPSNGLRAMHGGYTEMDFECPKCAAPIIKILSSCLVPQAPDLGDEKVLEAMWAAVNSGPLPAPGTPERTEFEKLARRWVKEEGLKLGDIKVAPDLNIEGHSHLTHLEHLIRGLGGFAQDPASVYIESENTGSLATQAERLRASKGVVTTVTVENVIRFTFDESGRNIYIEGYDGTLAVWRQESGGKG